jgi:glycosyltransferase involved in cell wall biosynthesis
VYEPYPFGSEGGNLRTLKYLIERADPEHTEFLLVVPFETPFTERVRDLNVTCLVVAPPDRVNRYGGGALRDTAFRRLQTAWDLLRHNLDLRKVIRHERVDVVYANCIRAVLCTMLGSLLTRTPVLWYVKGDLGNPFLDTLGFVAASKILFFCGTNRDDRYPFLVRVFARKTGVLKIGIDLDAITEIRHGDHGALRRELGIRPDEVNLIILGQLYRPKGVHFLLEALARVVERQPSVRLFIVGDHVIDEYQPYKEELVAVIRERGLEDHVVFTGWRADAMEILSLMDALVHPSLSEGFGRAVLEAMAMAKPVCASRVGGLRETVRDGENGFSFPPGDVDGLTERLFKLIDDKDLRARFGAAARQTVETDYLIDDKVQQFEGFVARLASGRDAPTSGGHDAP